jgi:hypothetical protein
MMQVCRNSTARSKALVDAHVRVLVLNAEHVVVAVSAQHAHERPPEARVMAPAAGAERPRAMLQVGVWARVVVAVHAALVRVELGVLGMHVKEQSRLAKLARSKHRVDALPEEVARVEVGAEHRRALQAARLLRALAHANERVRVVDREPRVRLPRHAHAVLARKLGLRGPVRHQHAFPLVLHDVGEVVGPRACHPVGRDVLAAAARATTERNHRARSKLRRKLHRSGELLVVLAREALLGVHRIAVHAERAQLEAVGLQHVANARLLLGARQHLLGVEEGRTGPCAHRQLDGPQPQLRDVVAHILELPTAEQRRHHAKLHGFLRQGAPYGATQRPQSGQSERRRLVCARTPRLDAQTGVEPTTTGSRTQRLPPTAQTCENARRDRPASLPALHPA